MADPSAVLQSFAALMQEEDEVTESFLLAAIYAKAVHSDKSPQAIVEDLFKLLPTGSTWRSQRRALLEAIE